MCDGQICGEPPCIIAGYTPPPAVVGGGTPAPDGEMITKDLTGLVLIGVTPDVAWNQM